MILFSKLTLDPSKIKNEKLIRESFVISANEKGSSTEKDSEFTFYQRFGYLFTVIDAGAGEYDVRAPRLQLNKTLLHTSDTSSAYQRKIDLLLKLNDTSVELSSSRWKEILRGLEATQNKKLQSQSDIY
ncbi:hypothetical protein EDC94DRAFT_582542 [Helicostylum pulchrum]|nr:hypothetical protein EDC94DRAFT_582542 [Helicostylum pulchrum]